MSLLLPAGLAVNRARDRGTFIGIGLVAVLVIADAGLAYRNTRALYQTANQVNHSRQVLDALGALLSSALNAETGQRGYLITDDSAYLAPYVSARDSIAAHLERVDALTRDSPAQQARVGELRARVSEKLEELDATITTRRRQGFAAAQRLVLTHLGKGAMDALRVAIREMVADEDRVLADRVRAAERSYRLAIASALVAGGVALLALGLFLLQLRWNFQSRTRAAAALEEQKELFRTTLASIGDAVITTDTGCRVTFLNPVAERLTGWSATSAHGEPLHAVFRIHTESTGEPADNPADRALREGTIVGLANHTVLARRDGSEIPIDDSAAPIRDAAGTIRGVVLVFRDITERRQAEKDLRDADRRKDEFLTVLAHELRNPLAPLRNALEIIQISPDKAAAVERVRGPMERQLRQMVRLIDDLIDVSRITRGKLELRREMMDLAEVVSGAIEMAAPGTGSAGHEIDVSLPDSPVIVHGDRVRLTQVLVNLLSNAARYSEPGRRIRIAVTPEGNHVRIMVADQGIGIPQEMLEQVFELFVQVESGMERTRDGLGVGLTLVRRIVELHGGTIYARSEGPGRGSEFVILLPVSS